MRPAENIGLAGEEIEAGSTTLERQLDIYFEQVVQVSEDEHRYETAFSDLYQSSFRDEVANLHLADDLRCDGLGTGHELADFHSRLFLLH